MQDLTIGKDYKNGEENTGNWNERETRQPWLQPPFCEDRGFRCSKSLLKSSTDGKLSSSKMHIEHLRCHSSDDYVSPRKRSRNFRYRFPCVYFNLLKPVQTGLFIYTAAFLLRRTTTKMALVCYIWSRWVGAIIFDTAHKSTDSDLNVVSFISFREEHFHQSEKLTEFLASIATFKSCLSASAKASIRFRTVASRFLRTIYLLKERFKIKPTWPLLSTVTQLHFVQSRVLVPSRRSLHLFPSSWPRSRRRFYSVGVLR